MKPSISAVIALVGSMLLTACATSGPKFTELAATMGAPGKPGTGRIYFYRTSVLGAAVQPEVHLNGAVVGRAVPNGFFFVDHPAGRCEISTSTEVERKLTFVLEPNQVRYVRLNISLGFFVGRVYGELIDEAKGAAEIADTRYTGPPLSRP